MAVRFNDLDGSHYRVINMLEKITLPPSPFITFFGPRYMYSIIKYTYPFLSGLALAMFCVTLSLEASYPNYDRICLLCINSSTIIYAISSKAKRKFIYHLAEIDRRIKIPIPDVENFDPTTEPPESKKAFEEKIFLADWINLLVWSIQYQFVIGILSIPLFEILVLAVVNTSSYGLNPVTITLAILLLGSIILVGILICLHSGYLAVEYRHNDLIWSIIQRDDEIAFCLWLFDPTCLLLHIITIIFYTL